MKGNLSKKKGLLSELTKEDLEFIVESLMSRGAVTQEDLESIKKELHREINEAIIGSWEEGV